MFLGDAMEELTQKRLKELLHYDPLLGVFTRKISVRGTAKGSTACNVCKTHGYRVTMIDGKKYRGARLAWLYMEGYFPENEIDHINRVKHDDRWKNLRHVSRQCNIRNLPTSKRNKSGIVGVSWNKGRQKWQARITVSGKNIFLGLFGNKTGAARARWNAEVKHGFPNCNTTSSAYLYLKSN